MRLNVWGGLALLSLAIPALAGQKLSSNYRQQAQASAGADLQPLYENFCKVTQDKSFLNTLELPPTRVFDNLVFLGRGKWNSWALLTSDGIILFDAMENETEAQHYIVEGLRSMGLDPATIKKVVVMHGHGDHSGGARLFQSRYGAQVYVSEADWDLLALTQAVSLNPTDDRSFAMVDGVKIRKLSGDQTVPQYDQVITDGMTLSLGDTSVRLYLTPGHTKGTVSAILPLQDGDKTYTAGFWGGTGFTAKGHDLNAYLASLLRFQTLTGDAQVSVAISNHPVADTTLLKWPLLADRQSDVEHPFVIGPEGYQRVLKTLEYCLRSYQEK